MYIFLVLSQQIINMRNKNHNFVFVAIWQTLAHLEGHIDLLCLSQICKEKCLNNPIFNGPKIFFFIKNDAKYSFMASEKYLC